MQVITFSIFMCVGSKKKPRANVWEKAHECFISLEMSFFLSCLRQTQYVQNEMKNWFFSVLFNYTFESEHRVQGSKNLKGKIIFGLYKHKLHTLYYSDSYKKIDLINLFQHYFSVEKSQRKENIFFFNKITQFQFCFRFFSFSIRKDCKQNGNWFAPKIFFFLTGFFGTAATIEKSLSDVGIQNCHYKGYFNDFFTVIDSKVSLHCRKYFVSPWTEWELVFSI